MERFVSGDIIVVPYPTFDFKSTKKRPAVVLATSLQGVVVCPITTKQFKGVNTIAILKSDLKAGKLRDISYAIPEWISTFQYSYILYKAGSLHSQKLAEILNSVSKLFSK